MYISHVYNKSILGQGLPTNYHIGLISTQYSEEFGHVLILQK
jgi:hypothetical protein